MKCKKINKNLILKYNEFKLEIQQDNNSKLICNNHPSEPSISPNKKYIAYIAPQLWEVIGNVYLYNINNNKNKVLLKDFPKQYKPKIIKWLDNNYILLIIGFAYGTVSVGGKPYLFNITNKRLTKLELFGEDIEVKKIDIKNHKIEFTLYYFDGQSYTFLKNTLISIDEIYQFIK